ncbi:MAG: dTDP-glucose 4,6-dehydratase [Bdellovibrionaceae bacterium]|nr:dTDP-glucose 4,6-dehydratase [Pseudobdellovibrionaceae bacterium]
MKKTNRVLITGGAGFIGSNFIPYFLQSNPESQVINLDKLTYAGNLSYLEEVAMNPNYKFVKGDIVDSEGLEAIFMEYEINQVIHFAAESHVDNSISGPQEFINTNIVGTFLLLDTARKFWMTKPGQYKSDYEGSRFLHISTDEVFGSLSLADTELFKETTPYAPNSPYSASKASGDFLVRSYFHTFGMDVVTTNCSNNYGPKQHGEKLIPTIIRKALNKEPIPIYGDGRNIRDWLYVLDHCRGIELAFNNGRSGETYNIGGGNEQTNIEIANSLCEILDRKRPLEKGSYKQFIEFVKDRPGHDRRYAIDASKITTELNWLADEYLASGLEKTVDWYLEYSL